MLDAFLDAESMKYELKNFVIEGVACQAPSRLRRLQATPPLQTLSLIHNLFFFRFSRTLKFSVLFFSANVCYDFY